MVRKVSIYILIAITALQISCKKMNIISNDKNLSVNISFKNFVGSDSLELNKVLTTSLGEQITISNFKYYISNIAFKNTATQKWFAPKNLYFLIDENIAESKNIRLTIPNKNYDAIEFMIGVDSLRNVSGVQTGALDPAKGMFWTWNSGYIQAKLEGYSPVAKSINEKFTYHIGGFKQNENTVRKVILSLKNKKEEKSTLAINIAADADKWFNGIYKLKIADSSFTMTPGKLAVQFADNYATMFSVINK